MKKYWILLCAVLMMAFGLTACNTASAAGKGDDGKVKIVATIFPEYDWVRNVLGENAQNAELTLLLDNGVDLHSYQPTAADILKISNCDLFIYVGGESDEWVEDVLKQSTNKNQIVINLLEVLGDQVKEEEIVEGMEHEHDHEDGDHDHEDADHDHEDGDHDHEDADDDHEHEHHHEDGEIEYDEHVWLSLKKAQVLCGAIKDALVKLDPAHAESYRKNCEEYQAKLASLDADYESAVKAAKVNTLLFGDRFPFRYLVDDYDLKYYAAFVGCSAETEASFETILFLAGKVDELKLPAILTIEGANHRIAETVKDNTKAKDQKILTMNSLQSVTGKDVEAGVTYFSVMEENLKVLKEALGQ